MRVRTVQGGDLGADEYEQAARQLLQCGVFAKHEGAQRHGADRSEQQQNGTDVAGQPSTADADTHSAPTAMVHGGCRCHHRMLSTTARSAAPTPRHRGDVRVVRAYGTPSSSEVIAGDAAVVDRRMESTGSAGSTRWAATYGREHRPSGNSHGTRRRWFVEVVAVDGSRLSPREQQILDQIERTLSQDEHLERELRTLHMSVGAKCVEEMRRMRTAVLAVLALASGLLLAVAARTPTAGPIAAFAVTCTAALALGVTVVYAWARRRRRP